jgi:hypothetical protein
MLVNRGGGSHAARFTEYFARPIVIYDMNTTHLPTAANYAGGYAKGRHAAAERVPTSENPYAPGSTAYQGWLDGHYDEQSARFIAIERHSAQLWAQDGRN